MDERDPLNENEEVGQTNEEAVGSADEEDFEEIDEIEEDEEDLES